MSNTNSLFKRCFLGFIIILQFLINEIAFAQVYVKGYYRKNGTYVQPHYRSSPNSTKLDNWSTKGNINPYTGIAGTKNVYENNSNTYDAIIQTKIYSGALNNNLNHETNVNIYNSEYSPLYNEYDELWGYKKLYYNDEYYIGYWFYDKSYKYIGRQTFFKHSKSSYYFDLEDNRIPDTK